MIISRSNVASVGRAFKGTRKVKVLSLPETIKEKWKSIRLSLETSIFPLLFQVVREHIPFVEPNVKVNTNSTIRTSLLGKCLLACDKFAGLR